MSGPRRFGTVRAVAKTELSLVRVLSLLVGLMVGLAVLGEAQAAPPPATPVKPKAVKPKAVKPKAVRPAGTKPAAAKPTPARPAGKPAAKPPPAGTKPAPAGLNPASYKATNTRESEIYGDRLDGLQSEVDQLKDKIFRSKARLALLKETVLRGVMAGSRIIIAHRNLMGSGFRMVRVVFIMDGAQIYARTDETGALDQEDELTIYDGNLPPGPHNVTVEVTYQGHGYGVFSYLSGYTFESRSSHSFTAPENGALKLGSIGFERGNPTTEMKDRPAVSWQEVPLDASGRPLPTRTSGSGAKKKKKK